MQLCSCESPKIEAKLQPEKDGGSFPWRNWLIALMLRFLVGTNYIIFIPTMHQFVTTTRTNLHYQLENTTNSDAFWPGLGMSESFYSWVVSMYSIGELAGAPIAVYMTKYIPYRYSLLLSALIIAMGVLLYALTVQGWMILIARLLLGVSNGMGQVTVITYIGETATEVTAKREAAGEKQGHSGATLKDKLFIWLMLVMVLSFPVSLAISSIMAQFHQLEPYHSPAWLVLTVTTLYIVLLLMVFKENRVLQLPKCIRCCSKMEKSEQEKTNRGNHRSSKQGWKDYMLYAFFVVIAYVTCCLYTLLDTLVNPILSDHFGFTVVDISYFTLGITIPMAGAPGILYILKKFHIDNRTVFMLSLGAAIVGGLIVSDWQSIGNDPCSAIELVTRNEELLQTDGIGQNSSLTNDVLQNSTNYTIVQIRRACELMSTPEDQCHWNPVSQLTGQYCQTCRPVCHSVRKSLNIIQFGIGALLVQIPLPIVTIMNCVIASDIAPLETQGILFGLIFTASALSMMISPLWVDYTYEALGKHIYAPMCIMSGLMVVVLVIFAVLYKRLSPRAYTIDESACDDDQQLLNSSNETDSE